MIKSQNRSIFRQRTRKSVTAAICLLMSPVVGAQDAAPTKPTKTFDSERDLISLHYDHAPDKDDGHSAAADRTVLEAIFGADWIRKHIVAVSGAYGTNRSTFNPNSDAVMKAAWDSCGGWLAAHENWDATVEQLVKKWNAVFNAGGHVWVKEGGQSDLTADVVREIHAKFPQVNTMQRIHVVQHSLWNEEKTGNEALAFVRANTHYIKISDANRFLNVKGGDANFVQAAKNHPDFGRIWQAAFDYYDPKQRLDFSDTGELFHILGLGEVGIDAFQNRFLAKSDGK